MPPQRVEYTSPNGVSALHRVGVHANAEGLRFGELGLDDSLVRTAFSIGAPVTEEIEGQAEVTVLIRCIPLHRPRHGVRGRACSPATSPSCAAVTGCCCPRTRRSARSTTG